MHDLIGAILAGGSSTRMGRDKSTLRMRDGRTMLERVADALRAASGEPIVAIAGASQGSCADLGQARGYVTLLDQRPHAGPLGGIEALLASGIAREYLVCPCDVPHITSDVLRLLLRHCDAPATVLRVPDGQRAFESLPARISAAALPTVTESLDAGERSVWRLMEVLPAAIVDLDERHAASLRNVNTPDDFNTL